MLREGQLSTNMQVDDEASVNWGTSLGDVGRGSPLDRCRHERRTGDTKKNLTRASQPQHHVNVNVHSLSQ